MLNFTEDLHTRPYLVTKRRCDWNKTFRLGHFMLHFKTFIMFLFVYMTTKASNARLFEEHEISLKTDNWIYIGRNNNEENGILRKDKSRDAV